MGIASGLRATAWTAKPDRHGGQAAPASQPARTGHLLADAGASYLPVNSQGLTREPCPLQPAYLFTRV